MIGLILAGVSAAASIFGGISAKNAADDSAEAQRALAKEQLALGKLNVANIRAEGAELGRRTQFQQRQVQGSAQAISAGSGISGGRSRTAYMNMMQNQHSRELDWIKKSTKSKVNISSKETDIAYRSTILGADATKAQGTASLFGGVSNAIGAFSGSPSAMGSLGGIF